MLGKILGLSIWTMVQNFISLATWFIFFLSVEHLGERDLAVTNVVRSISSFTFMTVISLASTASTLVSNLMGQGELEAVGPMLRRTIRLGFFILVPAILLIILLADKVLYIFTSDGELIAASYGSLYMMLSSYVFTIPAQILFQAVSGTGNTRTALAIELTALTIYCFYIGVAIFHFRIPLAWCWFSEYVYNILALALSFSYLKWGNWRSRII